MTDPARRVADLLRLAASTHSEEEAASVAVKAAKLFVDKKLSIWSEKEADVGVCESCGYPTQTRPVRVGVRGWCARCISRGFYARGT